MLNLLIVDDNIYYIKSLINYIVGQSQKLKIRNIATNGKEAVEMIAKGNIDLVLLDLKLPGFSGAQVLKEILNMQLSKIPKIIVISGEIDLINEVRYNPIVFNIANKTDDIVSIYKKIEESTETIETKLRKGEIQKNVMQELIDIGYNPKHKGTQYILESIIFIYESRDNNLLEHLEKNVYRRIACIHNKKEANIKTNIMKATDSMYIETRTETLKKYFHNNTDKKPTPKIVISTILNKV